MQRWKSFLLLGLLLVVTAVVGGGSRTAHASTTRGWTGAVSLNWNTAGNWSPAGVPVNGDSVVVAAAGAHITGVPSGLTLNSLTIGASVEISGAPLTITSAITVTRSLIGPALDLSVVLGGNVLVSVPVDSTLDLSKRASPMGTVAVNTAGYMLTKAGGGDLEFSGDLVGGGTLVATGGDLSFLYPVTFGGTISMGPSTWAHLTHRATGNGPGFCGSAPGVRFALTSAALAIDCAAGIGSVSGSGSLYLSDVARLSIAVTGETFDGPISGGASSVITCCAQGVQTLRGDSTFLGNIFVTGGSLVLEGATFPAASQFTGQGKGAFPAGLGGYGTFGQSILTTAILNLASVNGKFGLARFPFLQLAPDVTVEYEIMGATPGTGFTQVVMSGELFLDNALLSLDFNGYQPAAGQSLTLVKGATALFDTFRNVADSKSLAEGATFTADGMQFKITYKGGAGHDVVITRQGGDATPTPAPTNFKRFVAMVVRES